MYQNLQKNIPLSKIKLKLYVVKVKNYKDKKYLKIKCFQKNKIVFSHDLKLC